MSIAEQKKYSRKLTCNKKLYASITLLISSLFCFFFIASFLVNIFSSTITLSAPHQNTLSHKQGINKNNIGYSPKKINGSKNKPKNNTSMLPLISAHDIRDEIKILNEEQIQLLEKSPLYSDSQLDTLFRTHFSKKQLITQEKKAKSFTNTIQNKKEIKKITKTESKKLPEPKKKEVPKEFPKIVLPEKKEEIKKSKKTITLPIIIDKKTASNQEIKTEIKLTAKEEIIVKKDTKQKKEIVPLSLPEKEIKTPQLIINQSTNNQREEDESYDELLDHQNNYIASGDHVNNANNTTSHVNASSFNSTYTYSGQENFSTSGENDIIRNDFIAHDPLCIDFIHRLTRIISKFPGRRPHCTVVCSYSPITGAVDVVINDSHLLSTAYKSHIIATIQRTSAPQLLHGKKVKIII